MHLYWLHGIGRGSWELGNPTKESAKSNSGRARTDRPCSWVSPPRTKRVGTSEIIVVVVVVVVVVVLGFFFVFAVCEFA